MKKFKITLEVLNDYISRGLVMKQTHPTLPISVYNYSRKCQYENAWDEVTLACRGLFLDFDGNLVARGFNKFFNMEQLKPEEIPNESFDVFEKMDGCCDENVNIITSDGIKTIKDICENNFNGEVLSYNIFTNQIEMKSVIGTNISENLNNWYEIEIENGETIKLTENHMVYLPELNCYRRVDELTNDDIVLLYENVDNTFFHIYFSKTIKNNDLNNFVMKKLKIKNIKKIESDSKRYDISVEDNNNFFANNILVHNSYISLFNYNDKWLCASKGSFISDQAVKAQKIISKYDLSELSKDKSYCLELISPENRIVIDYGGAEDLIMLSSFNLSDGSEESVENLKTWKIVKKYDGFTNFKMLKQTIGDNQEGYVVRFKSGFRMKIKGEEYLRLHRIVTNITTYDIWEALKNDSIEEMLDKVPDEFDKWVRDTIKELIYNYISIQVYADKLVDGLREKYNGELPDKKTYAEWVFSVTKNKPEISGILFNMYSGKDYSNTIWKMIKPTFSKAFFKESDDK